MALYRILSIGMFETTHLLVDAIQLNEKFKIEQSIYVIYLFSKKNILQQRETLQVESQFFECISDETITHVDEICFIGLGCGIKAFEHACIHLRQMSSQVNFGTDDNDGEICLFRNASNTVESNAEEKSERK